MGEICEFCENEKTIIEDEVVDDNGFGYNSESTNVKKYIEAFSFKIGVFIDRGYLRLVDLDDCQCLDHGEKVKIKHCPFCGYTL